MELTSYDVLKMNAGRELDRLVAKHVTKYVQLTNAMLPDGSTDHTPNYSTDIAAAWEVVEKFSLVQVEYVEIFLNRKSANVKITVQTENEYVVEEYEATATFAPEAICKCALLTTLTE